MQLCLCKVRNQTVLNILMIETQHLYLLHRLHFVFFNNLMPSYKYGNVFFIEK